MCCYSYFLRRNHINCWQCFNAPCTGLGSNAGSARSRCFYPGLCKLSDPRYQVQWTGYTTWRFPVSWVWPRPAPAINYRKLSTNPVVTWNQVLMWSEAISCAFEHIWERHGSENLDELLTSVGSATVWRQGGRVDVPFNSSADEEEIRRFVRSLLRETTHVRYARMSDGSIGIVFVGEGEQPCVCVGRDWVPGPKLGDAHTPIRSCWHFRGILHLQAMTLVSAFPTSRFCSKEHQYIRVRV